MTEEFNEKFARDRFRQWHFWWLVVFSVLLIVTFAYYLPARFLNQIQSGGHMMEEEMEDDMHEETGGDHKEDTVTQDHGDLKVEMKVWPTPLVAGASLNLDFSAPISDLEIEHEKLMHVIGVRSDLNEFFHIHPVRSLARDKVASPSDPGEATSYGIHPEPISNDLLSIAHTFNKPGIYKTWSEVKKDGIVHAFEHPEINIQGEGPTEEKNVSFGRNVIVGDYQVSLEHDEPLTAKKGSNLYFNVRTLTGGGVELENYLGVPMHLAIIKDDLKTFIHTHPEDHHGMQWRPVYNEAKAHGMVEDEHEISAEAIEFSVNFPEPGLYKAFAQFRPAGIDLPTDGFLVAEFWLEVQDKKPTAIKVQNPWWMLLFVSIVLIIILSWAVKKFITVK